MSAPDEALARAKGRLEGLLAISRVLAESTSMEQAIEGALEVAARALPLRSALLTLSYRGRMQRLGWPRGAGDPEGVARRNAEAAFRYFSGALTPGHGSLDAPGEPGDAVDYVTLPLVVSRRPIFGVLQLEPAAALELEDLSFANGVANQLALALDRDRAWRRDLALRLLAERRRLSAERDKRNAEALRERYEALVDNLDHAFVWEADARTLRLSYVSARAENLRGAREPRPPDAEGWMAQVVPEDWPALSQAFARAAGGQGDQRCDHRVHTRFGLRWFQTRIHLAGDPSEGGHLQGVSLDVTPERQMTEAQDLLLAAGKALAGGLDFPSALQALARVALPRLGDYCVCDETAGDGVFRRVSAAQVDQGRVLERSEESGARERLAAPLEAAIRTGRAVVVEALELEPLAQRAKGPAVVVPLAIGERTLGTLTFGFESPWPGYGTADVALAEELGRRAAVALENARLYEQSRRAIEVREQILAIVSHDLRNPLGRITLALGLIGREPTRADDERLPRTLTTIRQAVEQMKHLIEDLLDFANIEAGRLSVTPRREEPGALLDEAVANFEGAARERSLRLSGEAASGVPAVCCDRLRVLQVLGNLVGNALKVVPPGGAIRIRAELRGDEVVFSVTDTGPGIALEEQPHLFERYFRGAAPRYRGTGLGLAIARGIVNAHGGRIWVASEPGKGASFQFTLPAWKPGAGATWTASEAPRA